MTATRCMSYGWFCLVTFPSNGPMWGKYVFFMANSQNFSYVLHLQLLFLEAPRTISLKWLCLLVWNVHWMGSGRVTLSNTWGPWEVNMSLLWQNPEVLVVFEFSISISGVPASYFNKMIMLISFECIVAQTRMGFGRVTLPSKVPMRGPMCLRYGKILKFFFL